MRYEKDGQSLDPVKETLLQPILVNEITNSLEEKNNKVFSLVDFGTGDCSYFSNVVKEINNRKYVIHTVAVVDVGTDKFIDIHQNLLYPDLPKKINTVVVGTKDHYLLEEFQNKFSERFDIAISQLVLHQILEDSEMSHLFYRIYQSLKYGGDLFLVDLHPEFIEYLADKEPDKFEVIGKGNRLVGKYNFDSGGSILTSNRRLEFILSMALCMGYNLVESGGIHTDTIQEIKDRYKKMVDEGVPMFYLMKLRKNTENFISENKGLIKRIKNYKNDYISITFSDNVEIFVPQFDDWEKVKKGDFLEILETKVTLKGNNFRTINFWVTPSKRDQDIIWNRMLLKVK
jgi:hypothetical protein